MESQVKFHSPRNILGASWQSSVAAFSWTPESAGIIQVSANPCEAPKMFCGLQNFTWFSIRSYSGYFKMIEIESRPAKDFLRMFKAHIFQFSTA